ncbi:hypothetical protein KC315_g10424, partial [Hortaea werneckii]
MAPRRSRRLASREPEDDVDRNARLTSRIDDLEEEVAKANPAASGRKRSLQQAAARERIERQAKQRRQ